MKRYLLLMTAVIACIAAANASEGDDIKWQEGYLDIHFMHTGGGNTSFIVFPDGTTLLFDAGDELKTDNDPFFEPFNEPSKTTYERIADYINFFAPNGVIDYAVMSHFHKDHYGSLREDSAISMSGAYRLTGVTGVGELIPIKNLIDRGYPSYNYPLDMIATKDATLLNYIDFIEYQKSHNSMSASMLKPGVTSQIKPLYNNCNNFEVRNVKVNQLIWLGNGDQVAEYPFNPPVVNDFGYYNENPLSISLLINYGDFDYFVGADIAGENDYPDYDVETPLANIVGEVDALSLNHHGYKDAVNPYYIEKSKPQVIAHQACHRPHFAESTLKTLYKSDADVYTMAMPDNLKKWLGRVVKNNYKSTRGNFFIRVYDQGKKFVVITLDETSYEPKLLRTSEIYKSNKN